MEDISVTDSPAAYKALEVCASGYYRQYANRPAGQVEGVEEARRLFHAIGIDPTRRRPSSEALLRRALKNKSLYSVNTLVDTGNWCSLDFLLPVCVYDADKIEGTVRFGLGSENDAYEALNGSFLQLKGRYCLADDLGAFGSPITDSRRSSVDFHTKHILYLVFAPETCSIEKMNHYIETSFQRIDKFCGGNIIGQGTI